MNALEREQCENVTIILFQLDNGQAMHFLIKSEKAK